MAKKWLLLIFMLMVSMPFMAAPVYAAGSGGSGKIKKCKDSQGKWHYGDRAAEECERAKIIELSNRGVKRGEVKAPPTAEELKEREKRKAELEKERQSAEEQARRDQQLLATYGHEQDIIYIRDRKLEQLEYTINAAETTIKPLRAALERMEAQAIKAKQNGRDVPTDLGNKIDRTRAQIVRHESMIANKQKEQDAIARQAEKDLQRYRELKTLESSATGANSNKKTP
ncbi:MAG: hypothetical protein R3268_10900 [Acidiferrobacterales bacterium]|nr:hypothetical protein [Acidiferrobacterales bacterium]